MALEVLVTKPTREIDKPSLLFVHGAWHGAWCWTEHFTGFFADLGYPSYAVDLQGHGASPGNLRRTRIAHYVANVHRVVVELPTAPIVIGHSMGGLVVQHYLARYRAPAAVLMAAVPTRGAIGATLRVATQHPLAFLRANLTLSLGPIIDDPQRATALLFGPHMDPVDAARYAAGLQDESYLAYLEMILEVPRPSLVQDPVLVLGAEQDSIFSEPEIHATARAYGTEAIMFPNMGHDMMLEPGWEGPAQAIAEWIERRPKPLRPTER